MSFNSFDNIDDLRARGGNENSNVFVLGYYTPDDGGGGRFYYDEDSVEDDNGGTIIQPTAVSGAGRWKRVLTDGIINVRWFGAKGDGATDDFDAIMAAYNGIPAVPVQGLDCKGTLYFPRSSGDYLCSATILINDVVNILGDEGAFPYMSTRIKFPAATAGIRISFPAGGTRSYIKNIQLYCSGLGSASDVTFHGIETNTTIYLDNVYVRDFAGDGILVDTTGAGNANSSWLQNIHCYENRCNNLHFIGEDSNACTIVNPDCENSGRCNILDESFLGNAYHGGHLSFAGSHPYQDGYVSYGGVYYAAKVDNIGVEPTVTADWEDSWNEFDNVESPGYVHPWAVGTQYYCNRAMYCPGEVQSGTIVGLYTEGGQNRSGYGGYNTVFGGTHGAGVDRYTRALFASLNGIDCISEMIWHDNPNNFVAVGIDEGLQFQANASSNHLQIKASNSDNWVRIYGQNSENYTGLQFPLLGISGSLQGRTGDVAMGVPHFTLNGFFMYDPNDGSRARNIIGSLSIPVQYQHGAGDFCINLGTDPTIVGWKCTVAGTPGTWVAVMAGETPAYVAKSSTYAITNDDGTIDCTSGTFTVTLPTAIGISGKKFIVKNSGVGTITIATTSSQTIDGSLTVGINSQYSTIQLQSTGANWIILN